MDKRNVLEELAMAVVVMCFTGVLRPGESLDEIKKKLESKISVALKEMQ